MHSVPSGLWGYVIEETYSVGAVTGFFVLQCLFSLFLLFNWFFLPGMLELMVLQGLCLLYRCLACFLFDQKTWEMLFLLL